MIGGITIFVYHHYIVIGGITIHVYHHYIMIGEITIHVYHHYIMIGGIAIHVYHHYKMIGGITIHVCSEIVICRNNDTLVKVAGGVDFIKRTLSAFSIPTSKSTFLVDLYGYDLSCTDVC